MKYHQRYLVHGISISPWNNQLQLILTWRAVTVLAHAFNDHQNGMCRRVMPPQVLINSNWHNIERKSYYEKLSVYLKSGCKNLLLLRPWQSQTWSSAKRSDLKVAQPAFLWKECWCWTGTDYLTIPKPAPRARVTPTVLQVVFDLLELKVNMTPPLVKYISHWLDRVILIILWAYVLFTFWSNKKL